MLHEVSGLDDFGRVVVRAIRQVVPADRVTYGEMVFPTWGSLAVHDPAAVLLPSYTLMFQHFSDDPLQVHYAASGDAAVYTRSDFVSRRAFRGTALYNLFYRPAGSEFQLAAVLPRRASMVSFTCSRAAGPDFSDRDRAVLQALRPHVAAAYAAAERLELLAAYERAGGPALVVRAGRVLGVHPVLRLLLATHFRSETHATGLPVEVHRWLEGGSDAPLTGTRDQSVLRLSVLVADRPEISVVVGSLSRPVEADELRTLGITARQRDVLALVCAGSSNEEIALQLSISPRTVKKHLEDVYRALGVGTRTAAAAVAFAAARG